MKKFYYKDILMRTSENHTYAFAIIKEFEDGSIACLGCSKDRANAEKNMRSIISWTIQDLEFYEKLNEARKSGKTTFMAKGHNRKETMRKTSSYDNITDAEEMIESARRSIEEFNRTVKIVEIEERY